MNKIPKNIILLHCLQMQNWSLILWEKHNWECSTFCCWTRWTIEPKGITWQRTTKNEI